MGKEKKGIKSKSKKQKVKDLTPLAEELVKMSILLSGGVIKEEKSVKVSFDKSQDQFTVRIPKGIGKSADIDFVKDRFNFTLEIKDGKPTLKGELIRE